MKFAVSLGFVAVLGLAALVGTGYFYSYVFSKTIAGEVVSVDRAGANTLTSDRSVAFSFGVAIKDRESGDIVTASSEDRQWAVVNKGMCAKAKIFPYPPWNLDKSGTYYGARLLKLEECR